MRVLVVDDEAPARRRLLRMLRRIADVEVVGQAADGLEARALIDRERPDLVLLDVQMPECDGLQLASQRGLPPIVFVTAHDEHAVAAFDLAAMDYLLKPVSQERLERAVERVRARGAGASPAAIAAALRPLLSSGSVTVPRVCARHGASLHVFDAVQIAHFHAADKYTVFWRDGVEYVLDETLAGLEARLGEWELMRVHRAELVNLAMVAAIHTDAGSMTVELRDGSRVPVSRRCSAELKRRLA